MFVAVINHYYSRRIIGLGGGRGQWNGSLRDLVYIWGCHIWACRERERGSDEGVKTEAVGIKAVDSCHCRSTFYSLNPRIKEEMSTSFTVCFTCSKNVHGSMLNKRCVTLPTVNCRPFAREVVFWEILRSLFTVPLNRRRPGTSRWTPIKPANCMASNHFELEQYRAWLIKWPSIMKFRLLYHLC